nr:unnamed protein product [Callosobruchus chinensis]
MEVGCKLRNICRACLTEEGEFRSIFVPELSSGLSLHLSDMIVSCAKVQISLGDGLPEQICSSCVSSAVNMYLFKTKCEESDKILRERLKKISIYYDNQYYKVTLNKNDTLKNDEAEVVQPGRGIIVTTANFVSKLDQPEEEGGLKLELADVDTKLPQDDAIISEDFNRFDFEDSYKQDESDATESECEPEKLKVGEIVLSVPEDKLKHFECEICLKRFTRNDLLLRHKIAHAMKMEEQQCRRSTSDSEKGSLDDEDGHHVTIKTEDSAHSCTKCDALFMHKTDLDAHVKKEHPKEEYKVSCPVCPKKFVKLYQLNRHQKVAHSTVERQYKCSSCDKTYSKPDQLRSHLRVHHGAVGAKPHVCDICFKGFNQISNLKDHMRTHNGEKPFLCSTCGKGFNQLGNLRQHTVRHSGVKAHLCSTCGSGFASKGELSAHLRKHTGARPFVCDVCQHGFTTSSSLTKHKRIHSGEKPYECDTCKMKFSRSGILARHKRTHTGEKPYKCNYCSKAFSQSNDLTSHLRYYTVHRAKPRWTFE